MPKQLNNGRVTQSLQSAFNFKGRYIPMLDEVIVPVYQIADPVPSEPALSYGLRTILTPPIFAGGFSRIRYRNPPGSGVLMVVTGVSIGAIKVAPAPATAESEITLFLISAAASSIDFANIQPSGTKRDTRNLTDSKIIISEGESNSVATSQSNTLAMALVVTELGFTELTGASATLERQPPVTVGPGFSLDLLASGADAEGPTPALTFINNISWSEVNTGELNTP